MQQRTKRVLFLVAPVAVVFGASSAALAADLRVGPSRTHKTIQAAVDAASPGDRIRVDDGVYRERVTVGTPRLTLLASGAVIDGTPERQVPSKRDLRGISQANLVIAADAVVVQGFVVTGGDAGIQSSAAGTTVRSCALTEIDGTAIALDGAGGRVERCFVRSCGGQAGVAVAGQGASLKAVRVEQCRTDGIYVTGDGARISGCAIAVVTGRGIYVSAPTGTVSACRVESVGGNGVEGNGGAVAILQCRVDDAAHGIVTDGAGSRVEGCRVEGTSSGGIRVNGAGVRVVGNRVANTIDDSDGIAVYSDQGDAAKAGGETLVSRNTVTDAVQTGIRLYTHGAVITANRVTGCGSEEEYAFRVDGDANRFSGNVATNTYAVGFYVNGSSNAFTGDRADGGAIHGFYVRGAGNSFTRCSASRFDGQGFSNYGTDTVLSGGTFRGNRLDVANAVANGSTFAKFTPSFGSGGEDVAPQID